MGRVYKIVKNVLCEGYQKKKLRIRNIDENGRPSPESVRHPVSLSLDLTPPACTFFLTRIIIVRFSLRPFFFRNARACESAGAKSINH